MTVEHLKIGRLVKSTVSQTKCMPNPASSMPNNSITDVCAKISLARDEKNNQTRICILHEGTVYLHFNLPNQLFILFDFPF